MPKRTPMERRTVRNWRLVVVVSVAFWLLWIYAIYPQIKHLRRVHKPWLRSPDPYEGRAEEQHPVARCCSGQDCRTQDRERHAIVTSVRSESYMTMLRELHCTLRRSNEGVRLIVLGVAGDLPAAAVQEIQGIAEYREVEDLQFPNRHEPRFALNWVKLRAFEMTELDAIIMLDTDMVVPRDLRHIFDLPTDFAVVPLQGHTDFYYNQGGFVFLRPCQATFDAMLRLLRSDERLQYPDDYAEQSFMDWYFRYTAWQLPMEYNFNFAFLHRNKTTGGQAPFVIHFANKKPFDAQPSDEEWPYLCWQPQQWEALRASGRGLRHRRHSEH